MPVPPVTAMSILERVTHDAAEAHERRRGRRRPRGALVLHPIRAWRDGRRPLAVPEPPVPVGAAPRLARIPPP